MNFFFFKEVETPTQDRIPSPFSCCFDEIETNKQLKHFDYFDIDTITVWT